MSFLENIEYKIKKLLVLKKIIPLKKNPDPIKWGIIGLGNMAEIFSTAINGSSSSVVYSVASRSLDKAKNFSTRYGVSKYYGSYRDMINDKEIQLDIIYIATPLLEHYDIIKECLLAGHNVLCEKPITHSSFQLDELISIAKQNNCFLMEGMWMKCLPTFRKAIEWIDKGLIGDPELIKVDFYKREFCNNLFNKNEQKIIGVLQDYGVYAISFITTFLKEYPDVLFFNKRLSSFHVDSDWQIYAEHNKIKTFVNISSNFLSQSKAVVIGNKGSIEWNSQFNRTNSIILYDSCGNIIEKFKIRYRFQGFEYQVEEVYNCLVQSKIDSFLVPLKETQITLKIIDELLK